MKCPDSKMMISALLVFFLVACASGSSIVTGTKRAPLNSNEVKLYLDVPASFDVIGIVSASSDAGWTEQGSQDYAVQELLRQAANLGANGVILETVGEKTTGFYGKYAIPVTAKTVTGKAIFVNE